MKQTKHIIAFILSLVCVFALAGCGAGQSGTNAQTSASAAQPVESSSAAPATAPDAADKSQEPTATADETATVTFQDDKNGTAVQQVKEGESFVAEVTIPFTYEQKDGKTVVTSLGEATARNISGWVHVNRAVTIDHDKTIYAKDGAKAAIHVIYEASVGSGYQTYDDSIYFDLSTL